MNQIARCDWLPERARWSHPARSGLPVVSRKQNFTKSHIINPLLTNFVRSRWLDIGLVLFFRVYGPRHAKKELGQYPAILTSHLVNNPCVSTTACHKGPAVLNYMFVFSNNSRLSFVFPICVTVTRYQHYVKLKTKLLNGVTIPQRNKILRFWLCTCNSYAK